MSKKKNNNQGFGKKHLYEEVYNLFKKNQNNHFNYKQIAAELSIQDHSTRILLNVLLEELTEQGLLTMLERGKYKLKSAGNMLVGVADFTQGNSAFVISPDSEHDIFISERYVGQALNGDTVKVHLFPGRNTKRPEGEIVEIVERKKTEFVGNVQLNKGFAFVVPDSNKVNVDFFIPKEKLNNAKDGEKVVVKLLDWEKGQRNPSAEVIKVLGKPGEHSTEMHAILEEYQLPYEFPDTVIKAAEKLILDITPEELSKRKDFRGIITFTIDPADAKDFDDALSIKTLPNGNYEIGVHIADVSHYLQPNTILDDEAYNRATSVYLVDRVVPMLPEVLSNDLCSLKPNVDRLCFSAVFEIDEDANVLTEWFGRTIIHSVRRFTYEEAQQRIETKEGDLSTEILQLDKLAKMMRKQRFKSGSIAFDKQEVKFNLNEKGKPISVYFKEAKDSNKLIEEFMLLANKKVSEYVTVKLKPKKHLPDSALKKDKLNSENTFIYRIHDVPNDEKLNSFLVLVRKLGYKFNSGSPDSVAKSINHLMTEVKEKPEANMIEQLAIRVMAKAEYSTDNIGHYGLGFRYYSHFTSPIRRYPDVIAHRLLQHYLDGKPSPDKDEVEEMSVHCSERERIAAEAERASIKYKQVEYLKDRIGMQFKGVITGVTDFGLFIELEANKCEGLVRMKDLTDDWYEYDEENFRIVGRRSRKIYRLGDTVTVEIKTADLYKKQLDYLIVNK
ncbi:MAG: ribonuclease R [Bacteroidia bacterium]|nr:ribonuclease R [Bacteroidia bacterium]